jgi:hypothetical protein
VAGEVVQTLDSDERQELERLRDEVARLRAEQAATPAAGGDEPHGPAAPRRSRGWARTTGAVLLIALGVLLAPLSVVSVWARGEVTDTERYVETVAPLAHDPAVQQAIATDITNQVFQYIDVRGLTQQAFAALAERGSLPPVLATQLQALAVPLSNGVRSFAEDQILKAVQTDVFATAWEQANRTAHQQVVAALTGEGDTSVRIEGGAVKVDMAAFLTVVKQRLVSSGFQLAERIPTVNADIVVFQSADLTKVQRGFQVLDKLGFWMPFVCLVLVGAGIYVARDHRRAFLGAGVGLAVVMLVMGVVIAAVRRRYLDGVPTNILPPDAAAVLFDTLVRFLRDAVRAAFLLGVLVAAAAFFSGPSITAVTARRWTTAAFAAGKGGLAALGLDLGPVTAWVAPRTRLLQVSLLVVAFLVLVLQPYRTPQLVGWVAVLVLAGVAIVQFLATPPREIRGGRPPVAAAAPSPGDALPGGV